MTQDSFFRKNAVVAREGDEPLFVEDGDRVYCRLDGYAIMPLELVKTLPVPTWKPIETAPTDNKRLLYLARFDCEDNLAELDFDGIWERYKDSWEEGGNVYYDWASAKGIEEPTHWAYQDEPIPPQPDKLRKTVADVCNWDDYLDMGGDELLRRIKNLRDALEDK